MHGTGGPPETPVAPAAPAVPEVGTTATGLEAPAGIPDAAAPPPRPPRKVLVVDDELDGLTAAHFRESAAPFAAEFGDLASPTTSAVWAIVAQLTGRKAFEEADPAEIEAFLSSDEFVRDVVLSDTFRAAAVPNGDRLVGFYAQADEVKLLRTQLEAAYSAPDFELTFTAARPTPPEALLDYDLVVLDLVLANSGAAVDELVRYLADLGNATYPNKLPCLMVLSSREEMVEHRPRFSTGSKISAAGLLLLEKSHVRRPQFGAPGLVLSYQQLDKQRDVAQHMRAFVREWMAALDSAMGAAETTLWNLDAAAMQEIHLSAISEDDPYDEHLNELVAREYMWHVETSADVSKAIESLDTCFQGQFKTVNAKVAIGERFIAPFVDSKPGRTIVSHYTWTGFPSSGALDEVPAATLATRFNRLVPFGAVLAPPTLAEGAECWVHITQQCDLNRAVRVKNPGDLPKQSTMFAIATAIEVNDRTVPVHETNELVARGLRIGDKEFDLKLMDGRMISLPIPQLITAATAAKMRVVGRLRHDIATHFLNATANHMTRPASLKTTRVEVRPARIFLWGEGLPESKPLPFLDAEGRDVREVMVSQHNKLHYFQDDASMWLALWITDQLRAHFGKDGLDAAAVCNTLRVGMRKNESVVSVLSLGVETRAFDQVDTFWTERDTVPKKPVLFVFYQPGTPN